MDQTSQADFLPGILTFLFSDLVDSTVLWEKYPEAMQAALSRHDHILKDSIIQHGGRLIKSTGDGIHAAFVAPAAAVFAAIAAQKSMQSESWDNTPPLRIRIGLHTGKAQYRQGDYYGSTVNRAARLMSIGHGGQILLSQATQELVKDDLPDRIVLQDMGLHTLRGLTRPEQVYQILVPGLLAEFPPLNSVEIRLNNLPAQTSLFIGRKHELAAITGLFRREDVRLVTLTGIGGIGKTRLSLQVSAEVLNDYRNGVYFIELAPVTDTDLLGSAIAGTLQVKEAGSEPILKTLLEYLKDKEMLLVLDNFEQIIDAAPLIGKIISAAPKVDILVTSREVLSISGEHIYPVPPLDLPKRNGKVTLDTLAEYESSQLFLDRAKAANPAFEVNEENAAFIAEICMNLEGLPLAIELAAARTRMFTPKKLLERLSDRLNLLKGGGRDLPARQQTLRGMVDWSYNLLSDEEQRLFACLAIFSGGWTLEAAENICGSSLNIDVLDGLESLVDKSLIQVERDFEDEPRFKMLETIHVYAYERLQSGGDLAAVQPAHADWFLEFAEEGEQGLFGKDSDVWTKRLQAEEENFRQVLEGCETGQLDPEVGVRMAGALRFFWEETGKFSEGRGWLRSMLSVSTESPPAVRAKALCGDGVLAYWQGDWNQVSTRLSEALDIGRQTGDQLIIGEALHFLAHAAQSNGENERGVQLLAESFETFRQLEHQWGLTRSLVCLADAWRLLGEYEQAAIHFEEVLAMMRNRPKNLLFAALLSNFGNVLNRKGEVERAAAYFREGVEVGQSIGNAMIMAYLLDGLAGNAVLTGRPERAARLLGASKALFNSVGVSSMTPIDKSDHDYYVDSVRTLLDEGTYNALWQDGFSMSLEEAEAYALEESVGWIAAH
ncbi:MAG: adenylate/guanylate cyclase domain-containing protein [Anaerolineales bacterium]|jgi:predicted ATPase/class 3 adenylate cyclase